MFLSDPTFSKEDISAFFDDNVTVTVRYSDKQKPITEVFQIFQLDKNRKPRKRVKVLNFNVTSIDMLVYKKVVYHNYTVKITFAPEDAGDFQLYFVIFEHNGRFYQKFKRSGPVIRILKHCK